MELMPPALTAPTSPARPSADSLRHTLTSAQHCARAGKLEEAAELFRNVLAHDQELPDALFGLALVHHSSGRFGAAITLYRQLLKKFPDHGTTLEQLRDALTAAGRLREARETCQRLLAVKPDHADAHLGLGLIFYEEGQLDAARRCYQRTLELDPGHHLALYNLGVIHHLADQPNQAEIYYRQALAEAGDDADIHINLAIVLTAQNRDEEALSLYLDAARLTPDDPQLLFNLGTTFRKLNRLPEARDTFARLVELVPGHGAAHGNLGVIHHQLGNVTAAIQAYRKALALGHNAAASLHMINALNGHTTRSMPSQYVEQLFDGYAERFDLSLQQELDYQTPRLIFQAFQDALPGPLFFERVLDLGCGTGLAGELFRPLAGHLHGVDLSAGMIEQARSKHLYDRLDVAELVGFLKDCEQSFDLFIATDVLVYLGDLDPLFAAIRKRATPGACFICSTELSESRDIRLRSTGRYAHSHDYVAGLAACHGFSGVFANPSPIRKEKGMWIPGEIFGFRLRKPRNGE